MDRRTEWLNSNQYRKYPLVEDCIQSVLSVFPDSCLLDFSFASAVAPAPVYLSQIDIQQPGAVVEAVFTFTCASTAAFTFTVPANAATPYFAEISTSDIRATLVVGVGIEELCTNSIGSYAFSPALEVEPALCHFAPGCALLSVQAPTQDVITGHILFSEGYNCSIAVLPDSNSVRISAIVGAGAGRYLGQYDVNNIGCDCALLYINGMRGADTGEFILQAGSGVQVSQMPGAHVVSVAIKKDGEDCL